MSTEQKEIVKKLYEAIPDRGAKVLEVTPAIASAILSMNKDNRRLQKNRVRRYKIDMLDNRWQFHGQGITLGLGGLLTDGQHRLAAIEESGMKVRMTIARNDSLKKAHNARVDTGYGRDIAYLLGRDAQEVQIAKAIISVISPWPDRIQGTGASVDVVGDLYSLIRPEITHFLEDGSKRQRKRISNAAVRAGCVLRMILHPDESEYICEQYRRLVERDYRGVPNLSLYLEKKLDEIESAAGVGQRKRLLMTYLGMDPSCAHQTRKRWPDNTLAKELEKIRSLLGEHLKFRQTRIRQR